jgi:hypothetical protein
MANAVEVKPGTYTKRPGGVEQVMQVRTYFQCELCEYNTTDEEEMKDHAKNPGLHKGGTPTLAKTDEEQRINEPGTGRTNPKPKPEPDPLTEAEEAEVKELVDGNEGDDLQKMAEAAGAAKSGSKTEVATRIVIAKRG